MALAVSFGDVFGASDGQDLALKAHFYQDFVVFATIGEILLLLKAYEKRLKAFFCGKGCD